MQLSEASNPLFLSSCEPGSSTDRRKKSLSEWDRSGMHMVINPLGLFVSPCQESGCCFRSAVLQHTGCPNKSRTPLCRHKVQEQISGEHTELTFCFVPFKSSPLDPTATTIPLDTFRRTQEGIPPFCKHMDKEMLARAGSIFGPEGSWRPPKDSLWNI